MYLAQLLLFIPKSNTYNPVQIIMSTPRPINKKLSCIDAVKRRQGSKTRPAVPSIAYIRSCRDRSGSMSSYGRAPGDSLYSSIEDHKKNSKENNVKVFYSLTTFDTIAETHFDNEDIHQVEMTLEEARAMVSPRDLTRLYATAMEELAKLRRSVKESKAANPDKQIVGVFELHTDGQDNESAPFTSGDLNAAVKAARAEGITCIFAGANQDAVTVGEQYGFDRDLSLTTDSTPQNASTGLRMASQAVMRACSGAPPQFTHAMRQSSAPVHTRSRSQSPLQESQYSPSSTAAATALLALAPSVTQVPALNLRQPAIPPYPHIPPAALLALGYAPAPVRRSLRTPAVPPGRIVRQTNNEPFV